jgi:hypothetical protein
MGMEKVYTCNICKQEKEASELKGFWFETNDSLPRLTSPETTENIHICKTCQGQLASALRQEAIDYTC